MKFLVREIRASRKEGQEKGDLHFQRWRMLPFGLPWFNIYIHIIYKGSKDRYCHDHPWPFMSLVLWGGYTEQKRENLGYVYDAEQDKNLLNVSEPVLRERGFLNLAFMNKWDFHNLHKLHKTTVTLVVTGKRKGVWGFYLHDMKKWVSQKTYSKLKGKGVVKNREDI